MAYNIIVFNNNGESLGVVSDIFKIEWKTQFLGYGQVTLQTIYTEKNAEILREGHILWKNDGDTSCVIENVEMNDAISAPYIKVIGYIKSRLQDRIGIGDIQIKKPQDLIDICNLNSRGINVRFNDSYIDKAIDYSASYKYLNEIALNSLSSVGLSYKMIYDNVNNRFDFEIYQGIDRTSQEDESTYIGFIGDEVGTAEGTLWGRDVSLYKNYAIIKADNNKTFYIGQEIPIEERKEMFIDLSSETQTYREDIATGEIDEEGNPVITTVEKTYTDEEYKTHILTLATEKMNQAAIDDDIAVNMSAGKFMTADKDFHLGDLLPCKNVKFKLNYIVRVTEINYLYDANNGYSVLVTVDYERSLILNDRNANIST